MLSTNFKTELNTAEGVQTWIKKYIFLTFILFFFLPLKRRIQYLENLDKEEY